MSRFSIARSLRLVLIGLTLVMAAIAAGATATLYSVRTHYENALEQSSQLTVAVADLRGAGTSWIALIGEGRPAAAAERSFTAAAGTAARRAAGDPVSARLVARQTALERAAARAESGWGVGAAAAAQALAQRAGGAQAQSEARELARWSAASGRERSQSRDALTVAIVCGLLAVLAALAVIGALVRAMRRPLDELVAATGELAAGELQRRVLPTGPRELRELGVAFNAMGADLAGAHRRIEEQRRRLAVTIESLGDGLIVTEAGSSAIVTVNPRAAELIPELAANGTIDGVSGPLPRLADALAREAVIEHHGRTLAVTAARLCDDDEGVVWTLRDATERARLERATSEFVATASHELRSPLTSIKGFVELLQRRPEGMSSRQREFVDIILRSTDRLVDLVNDLLDVARLEADQVEIDRQAIDVGEAVHEIAELMGPRIAAKDQRLGVYVAPTLPLALADAGRLRQVIANLLTNAHLYTPHGGRIHIGAEADRAWVRIVVADSGVGMTGEESERAFDRFYRSPEGGAAVPGTGLGLSIVKSLVELHGGRIDIESAPGRGTTVHVLIPAAAPSAERPDHLDVMRGRRVLIVDDDPDVAALIEGQLAPLEVETAIATGGEDALRRLRSGHFDAVTLDVLMPGLGGAAVLAQIRADPALRATPVVIVSVVSDREDLAGEWGVAKPIDADVLRGVLAAAMRAARSRVLVVGREELASGLEPALDDLGIEHEWETTGAAAARVCRERRFELALIDVGVRNPQAVLEALDLRGRRLRRTVILFADEDTEPPSAIVRLGLEVVPIQGAADALLSALRGDSEQPRRVVGGAPNRS